MANAREVALKVLYAAHKEGAYINIELNKKISESKLSGADKRLVTEICHGVLKYKITLDYIIRKNSSLRLNKIASYVLNVLRMGIYQIKFMDKIPDSAAVNESVFLARKYGGGKSAGFVNAVLRAVIKNEIEYPKNEIEFLSVKYSYPLWLCERFIDTYGFEFSKAFMEKSIERPRLSIRVNTLKISVDDFIEKAESIGVICKKSKHCNVGLYVSELGNLLESDLFKDGFFYVQDIASMLVCDILNPKEGDTVIDVCAAPGGKTTYIAEKMKNRGKVFAFDIYEHKIKLIEDNAKRLGIDIIYPMVSDASKENVLFLDACDAVLVDAPCSGLGIVGKKPDIKYNITEEGIKNLADISFDILNKSAKYVKKGGYLVFSLCTITKEESVNNVMKFLNENKNFRLERIDFADIENEGYITLYPNVHNTDGFFAAKFVRID